MWPRVAAGQRNFAIAGRFLEPGRISGIDETVAKVTMARLYGRSPVTQCCFDGTRHGHCKTLTLLSTLRSDGVLRDTSVLYDGAMNEVPFLN